MSAHPRTVCGTLYRVYTVALCKTFVKVLASEFPPIPYHNLPSNTSTTKSFSTHAGNHLSHFFGELMDRQLFSHIVFHPFSASLCTGAPMQSLERSPAINRVVSRILENTVIRLRFATSLKRDRQDSSRHSPRTVIDAVRWAAAMGSANRDGAILMGKMATTYTVINNISNPEKAQNELQGERSKMEA